MHLGGGITVNRTVGDGAQISIVVESGWDTYVRSRAQVRVGEAGTEIVIWVAVHWADRGTIGVW